MHHRVYEAFHETQYAYNWRQRSQNTTQFGEHTKESHVKSQDSTSLQFRTKRTPKIPSGRSRGIKCRFFPSTLVFTTYNNAEWSADTSNGSISMRCNTLLECNAQCIIAWVAKVCAYEISNRKPRQHRKHALKDISKLKAKCHTGLVI